MSIKFSKAGILGLLLAFGLSACATAPTDPIEREIYDEENDPLRPLNETIFEFNLVLYKALLKPAGQVYEAVLPELVQDGIRNFLKNLKSPVVITNHILQGEPERAGDALGRFMFNTMGGAFGVFDVATDAGIPDEEEDFGQTLAVWGVDEGPYLVLPFFGSSNARDATGLVVDTIFDPLFWAGRNSDDAIIEYNGLIRASVDAVDTVSRNYRSIDSLEATSLDFYATVRSLYRQERDSLIRNGEDDDVLPDISFDDEEDEFGLYEDQGSAPDGDAG